MTNRPDRDRVIEQLLRQVPLRSSPVQSEGCMDAEQLAAWTSGSLRDDEAAVIETHLADCAHCQAMLAVFSDSEPVGAAVVPFWQRWTMRWLVPVAAASAAVLVWAVVTRDAPSAPAPTTMASVEQESEPPIEALRDNASARPETAPEARARTSAAPPEAQDAAGPSAPAPSAFAGAAQPVPAPPASAPMPRLERSMDVEVTAETPRIVAQSGESVIPSPPAVEQAPGTVLGARGQNNVMDGIAAVDTAPMHARIGAQQMVQFGAPRVFTPLRNAGEPQRVAAIPSPASSAQWRILAAGGVERSLNNGQSWIGIPIDPSLEIIAGSAPAARVCWLVSRSGVVLRTTNADVFERTSAIPTTNPVSVIGVDADQATVVAEDGRVFTTSDAGATWRQAP